MKDTDTNQNNQSKRKGMLAEKAAAAFLVSRGFEIIRANYTVRGAEIDIIAKENDCIVFVEVKWRTSCRYSTPRESVTDAKKRRICMAALQWLQENSLQEANVRFDIIEGSPQGMTLLRAAFSYVE